jgi:hypothetical protein
MSTSIDTHLGPALGRYFGEGFKRVRHELRDVSVVGDKVHGVADVSYPHDWSRKAAGSPPPHLSTVDGVVLAVQLAEIHLTHTCGLSREQRRRAWLRRIELRAGPSPQNELAAFPVGAAFMTRTGSVSTYACNVGAISVRCEIDHEWMPPADTIGAYASADDLLGRASRRYFGDGYTTRALRLDDVMAMADRVHATVRIDAHGCHADEGLAGAYQPSVSIVDAFLALAQLAQVLAYRLDGLERSVSDTLWMRRVMLESAAPRQPLDRQLPAAIELTRARRVNHRGREWRTLEACGRLLGISARASMAHRLPAPREERAA